MTDTPPRTQYKVKIVQKAKTNWDSCKYRVEVRAEGFYEYEFANTLLGAKYLAKRIIAKRKRGEEVIEEYTL